MSTNLGWFAGYSSVVRRDFFHSTTCISIIHTTAISLMKKGLTLLFLSCQKLLAVKGSLYVGVILYKMYLSVTWPMYCIVGLGELSEI